MSSELLEHVEFLLSLETVAGSGRVNGNEELLELLEVLRIRV